MARNGSGTYSLPAGNPVVSGAAISSSTHNTTMSDIATALTQSLASDGQTVPTADLPMGAYKHSNVGNATARANYAAAGQVQDSSLTWAGTAGGTADAITLTLTPAITAYAAGQSFTYKSGASANTTTMTVNVNSVGAKAIQKNGSAMAAGDHPANSWFRITYDGAAFQIEQIFQPSAFMLTVLDDTTAGAARTTLGAVGLTGNETIAGNKTFSGQIIPSQTSGIVGTTTNNNANAGSVGEYVSSTVLSTSAVSLTTSVSKNVTSISLTAGDWDVGGDVLFVYGATTSVNHIQGSISQTTGVMDQDVRFSLPMAAYVPGTRVPMGFPVQTTRISLSGSATIYLVAYAEFTVSTMSAYGAIWARRRR